MSHPVDLHVGAKLKELRILRGFTQSDLGDELDLSFQQLQKYETGSNRVSASRLHSIAQILKVRVEYFFSGLPGEQEDELSLVDTEALRIAASIAKITSPPIRKQLTVLVKELAVKA